MYCEQRTARARGRRKRRQWMKRQCTASRFLYVRKLARTSYMKTSVYYLMRLWKHHIIATKDKETVTCTGIVFTDVLERREKDNTVFFFLLHLWEGYLPCIQYETGMGRREHCVLDEWEQNFTWTQNTHFLKLTKITCRLWRTSGRFGVGEYNLDCTRGVL